MRTLALAASAVLLLTAAGGCLGGDGKDPPKTAPPPTPSDVVEGRNKTLLASFTVTPVNPSVGQVVRFKDASKDAEFDLVSWAWDFGDGKGSTQRDPAHVYVASGVYRVVLRVKNEADLEARATRLLAVPNPTGGGGGNQTPPPEEYLVFGSPVTVQESDGGEPSLAIDDDGRIYVGPIGSLYRSTDGGKTFDRKRVPGPMDEPIPGDSHVFADKDDRVWFSNLGGFTLPGSGSASVYASTDHGDTWPTGNPAATDSVQTDRQWLAAPGGGVAYLLFRQCLASDPVSGVCLSLGSRMTKTTNGGLTWTPLTGGAFEWTSYPVVDPRDGTLYVFEYDAQETRVAVQVSTNGGSSWNARTIADRKTGGENLFVSGAVDEAGHAYVAWIDRDTDQFDVYVAVSKDRGTTWSAPIRVSAGVGTAVFPWVAAGGYGRVVVAWYGTNRTVDPNTAPATTPWHVYAAYTSNATVANVTFTSSRATGVVHVGQICLGGAGCAAPVDPGDPEPLFPAAGDRDLLDFLSVALLPDGKAVIAYGEDGSTQTTKTRVVVQSDGPLAK